MKKGAKVKSAVTGRFMKAGEAGVNPNETYQTTNRRLRPADWQQLAECMMSLLKDKTDPVATLKIVMSLRRKLLRRK